MPGKIVDSKANQVNGNKAEWHLTGKTMSGMKMYARSEVEELRYHLLCRTLLKISWRVTTSSKRLIYDR
jgi:hypothetical protein